MPPNDVLGQVTGGARAQTVRSYVDALRRAKTDPRIDSVLIVPTHFDSPYWGKVQEMRDAILDFRKSGKRISAYLEYGGDREYYLATAADKIYLMPSSGARLTGVATYEVFLKGTLDKIGAQADFENIGDYKTAPNQLTQTTLYAGAPRDERVADARHVRAARARHRRGRKKTVEDVRALIDEGRSWPSRRCARAWSMTLAYEDQLDDHGAVSKSGTVEGEVYARAAAALGAAQRAAHGRRLRHRASSTPATADSIRSTARWRARRASSRRSATARADDRRARRSWCASTARADRASRRT